MARGRPQKRARNTTGLRNQRRELTRIVPDGPDLPNAEPLTNVAPTDDSHENSDPSTSDIPERELGLYFDSAKFIFDNENAGIESDLEIDELSSCGDWGDEDLQESLIRMAANEGDNPSDENWLPYGLRKKKKPRTGEFQSSSTKKFHLTNHRAAQSICKGP